jgi:osmotically-inducible protein OsmY
VQTLAALYPVSHQMDKNGPYDAHVTVTVKNGVVTLHGIVFDDWDLRTALRIARRAPRVKRVVNDLEIKLGGE